MSAGVPVDAVAPGKQAAGADSVTGDVRVGERKLVSVTPVVVGGSPEKPAVVIHLFVETPVGAGDGDDRQGSPAERSAGDPNARVRALTAREHEVLQFVSLGWGTPRIAEHLEVSLTQS